jgi:hypothetical protein
MLCICLHVHIQIHVYRRVFICIHIKTFKHLHIYMYTYITIYILKLFNLTASLGPMKQPALGRFLLPVAECTFALEQVLESLFFHGWNVLVIYCWAVLQYLYLLLFVC